MRALWLDYQQGDPGRRRSGFILLVIGVLVTSLLLTRYFTLADELSAAGLQLSNLQREVPADEDQGSLAELPTAAHWEALFHSLEAAGDESVTLLRVQSANDGLLLSGEARSLDASMAYVTRLQSAPLLADVQMTESAVVIDHPQRPVRFTLVVGKRAAQP